MDHAAPGAAEKDLRVVESCDALDEADLEDLSSLHRMLLPRTASSRCGSGVIRELYRAALRGPVGCILVFCADRSRGELDGAFALGAVNLRETEASIRKRLLRVPGVAARLAVRNMTMPWHAMARMLWERVIPERFAGYILTIGATPASPVRGRVVLRALEDRFAERGLEECWVDTEASNRDALRFYERNGYEAVSRKFGQVLFRKVLGRNA